MDHDLPRAGCWAHARRKFVDAAPIAQSLAQAILRLIKSLFELEDRAAEMGADQRLGLRQVEVQPVIEVLHALLAEQKAALLPKHPMAQAIGCALNQRPELTLFLSEGAVPIHNNLVEQEMKPIALLRKNALFVGTGRGGETAAILSSLTSTRRRHGINPQAYLTHLLTNLPDSPMSRLDEWLPNECKKPNPLSPSLRPAPHLSPELPR